MEDITPSCPRCAGGRGDELVASQSSRFQHRDHPASPSTLPPLGLRLLNMLLSRATLPVLLQSHEDTGVRVDGHPQTPCTTLANLTSLISQGFTTLTAVISPAMMSPASFIVQNRVCPGRGGGRGCLQLGNGEGLLVPRAGDPISPPAWQSPGRSRTRRCYGKSFIL